MALPFGLAFALLVPPMQFPDEGSHFLRAYQVSEGVLLGERWSTPEGALEAGGPVPRVVFEASRAARGIALRPERRVEVASIRELLATPFAAEPRVRANFWNTSRFSPAPYLPQALAIALVRPFRPSAVALMYTARLAGLAFCLTAIFLALRWTPFAAWGLFVIATLPMSVTLFASTGADGTVIAASTLLVAAVLRFAHGREPRLRRRHVALLAALAAGVGLGRQVYFLLPLLFALIPSDRSPSRRAHALRFAAVLGAALVPWAIWTALATRVMVPPRPKPWVDPWAQLANLLADPLGYAAVLLRFAVNRFPGEFLGTINNLGWHDVPLPPVLLWLAAAALLAALLLDRNEGVELRWRERALAAGIFAASFAFIATSAYLYWTKPGAPVIHGFQGRYLLPLAPLALVIAGNPGPPRPWAAGARDLLRLLPIASAGWLALALLYSLDRYYGPGG